MIRKSLFVLIMLYALPSYPATQISTGGFSTCALLNDGTVSCWGDNQFGQLGDGSGVQSSSTPVNVRNLNNVKGISVGRHHACALLNDSTVSCWGRYPGSNTPVGVSNLNNVMGISAGWNHTCAFLNDGTVSCWGDNQFGQLGDGSNTSSSTPVKVKNLNNVISISGGVYHTCALLNDRTVSCWGYNEFGQLGNRSNTNSNIPVGVSNLNNVMSISTGWAHTCVLLNDGTVSCWGDNRFGELGNGSNANSITPVRVSDLNNVMDISSGQVHTCARLNNGTVSCWGNNNAGQLGNGSNIDSSNTPVGVSNLNNVMGISAIGIFHTCALLNDGTVSCWGDNRLGQLGNGQNTNSNIPVSVLLIEDSDQDGRADNEDNCPQNANPDQANFDGDAYGDACDTDIDDDGIDNTTDNCQFNPNPDQADLDRDGIGDVCDSDLDGDGINNTVDNCPLNSNPDQADLDHDGIGDVCDVACEPAVYSNQTDQAYLPALEIPLATKIDGKAINVIGLYSASLEIPFGFDDFKVKELTFIQTIAATDPCHATFMPDTGILTIPTLEVTAVISYLSPQLIEGPVLTCSATLQQSVLKPEVLSLIEYNCQLP